MKFSVIMPSYNHGLYIEKAINSVLNQSCSDLELIIIDNYSIDNTNDVLDKFKDNRIKIFKFNNNGVIAASRNYGIQKAKGAFIAFIDSDDIWYENKLEISYNSLNKSRSFIFHPMDKLINNKIKTNNINYRSNEVDIFKILFQGNIIPTSSVIIRRKLLIEVNMFNEDKKLITSEDFELWLRILNFGCNAYLIPKTLGCIREHSSNSSSNLKRIINAGIYAIKKNINNLKLSHSKIKLVHKKSLAFLFFSYAMFLIKKNDPKGALKLLKKALRFDCSKLIYSISIILSLLMITKNNFFKIVKQ